MQCRMDAPMNIPFARFSAYFGSCYYCKCACSGLSYASFGVFCISRNIKVEQHATEMSLASSSFALKEPLVGSAVRQAASYLGCSIAISQSPVEEGFFDNSIIVSRCAPDV